MDDRECLMVVTWKIKMFIRRKQNQTKVAMIEVDKIVILLEQILLFEIKALQFLYKTNLNWSQMKDWKAALVRFACFALIFLNERPE